MERRLLFPLFLATFPLLFIMSLSESLTDEFSPSFSSSSSSAAIIPEDLLDRSAKEEVGSPVHLARVLKANFSSLPPPRPLPHRRNPNPTPSKRKHTILRKKVHVINTGKRVGLLFIGVATLLQVAILVYLLLKRKQMMQVVDKFANGSI